MANDRRIITGTHIVAKEGKDLETGTKYIIDSTVGKSLGGKSIVTDVDANQWHASNWYVQSTAITHAPVQLTDGVDSSEFRFLYIRNLDATNYLLVSLGVEQVWDDGWSDGDYGGDHGEWDYAVYTERGPNYDGWWDEGMHIKVPAGASIQLRGDDTNALLREVYARTEYGISVNIEFVIAQ